DEGAGAGSVLLAFILGAVSGAAVALLYAPASGRDTRDYIGENAREGKARAAEAAAKGRDALAQGRETLSTAIDRGREAYPQARRSYEPSQPPSRRCGRCGPAPAAAAAARTTTRCSFSEFGIGELAISW